MVIRSIEVAVRRKHGSYILKIMRQEDYPGTFSTTQVPLKTHNPL